jgi:hypothetical protein
MWWVPGTASGVGTISLYFAWLLSHPTWGWCGWPSLPPILFYGLWLTWAGTEPPDRRCSIPVHHVRRYCFSPPFRGVRSPWVESRDMVLTARSLMDCTSYGKVCLYHGVLILRVIMVIMCVPVVELLCQTSMVWLSILKYLLSGTCGCLLSCLVVPGIKCHCFPMTRLRCCLSDTEKPLGWLPGAWVCPEPRRWDGLGWQVMKSCPYMAIEVGVSVGVVYVRV